MARASALLLVLVLLASIALPAADGLTAPSAELLEREVHNNFMEDLEVRVINPGPDEMVIVRVSVTIDWPGWAPTLYPVFEGREVLAAGEERTFRGAAVRMPQTDVGTYPAFVAVVTETAQGQVEHRSPTLVTISNWGISWGGVPEYIVVPSAFAGVMLLITAALFRLERRPGWPPFRAVPRAHHRRRT